MGLDTASLKDQILTQERRNAIEMGCRSITVDGISFKVKDKTVVTVY
jgi:hypothetical protein